MPEVDDFKVVTRRRRANGIPRGLRSLTKGSSDPREEPIIDIDRIIGQIQSAVVELRQSGYRNILLKGLDEALKLIEASTFKEILCYGLGNFSQTKASKYQLAAVLLIEDHYKCKTYLYDPLFFTKEIEILEKLGLSSIESNEEAKRTIGEKISIVYMPHCPYQLTNNFIYANWTKKSLRNCLILSNSFEELVDSLYVKNLKESVNYLAKIQPYTTEIRLKNFFEHEDIFNGSSAHIFPDDKLSRVPKNFWKDPEEPIYLEENCEFVKNSKV